MKTATREWVRCAEEDFDAQFRYPGHTATKADARQALKACRSVRTEVRLSLGLPGK
jgi:hypothetical protein